MQTRFSMFFPQKTRFWLGLLLVAAGGLGLSAWITQGFHPGCYYHPMEDTPLFCHSARLFATHLSPFPWPQLDLAHSNATLFPIGSNHFFAGAYMFEANWLTWLLQPWGGVWIPVYAGYSFVVLSVGAFLLLYKPYGLNRAVWFTLLLLFLNPALLRWFPNRMNGVFVHWAVLGLITDVLLLRDVRHNRRIAFGLLGLRMVFLCLAMGLETGYIAAFALTEFSLFGLFYGYALYQGKLLRLKVWSHGAIGYIQTHPWRFAGMLSLMGVAVWLYVPILFQVLFHSFHGNFIEGQGLRFASPLRLLLPYFPFLHPGNFQSLFDLPEKLWSSSVGWALLIGAAVSLWQQRRRMTPANVFVLVLIGLLLSHIPNVFSVLQLLPWHHFSRIADRFAVFIPVLFLLLALDIRWQKLPVWVPFAFLVLIGVEITTLYTNTQQQRTQPRQPQSVQHMLEQPHTKDHNKSLIQALPQTPSMQRYFRTVQRTQGIALFNWPFCLHTGSLVGREFCPFQSVDPHRIGQYYDNLALKKTNQHVTGYVMITPSYLRFARQGWEHALMPNAKTYRSRFRQQRCLNTAEKNLITAMLERYDFAGIQLHRDLLAPHCLTDFYASFGQPVVSTTILQTYPLEFIPNPWREKNPTPPSAVLPRLEFAMDGKQANFMSHERPYAVSSQGLHYVYHPGLLGKARYSRGPKLVLRFFLKTPRPVRIEMQGHSRHNKQALALFCPIGAPGKTHHTNSQTGIAPPAQTRTGLSKHEAFQIDHTCQGVAGWNEVSLSIKEHHTPSYIPWRLLWSTLQKEGLRGLKFETLRLNWKHWLQGGVTFTQLQLHF